MKFALDHGIDRILSALAAFALYRVTPVNHGAWTWAGALAILGVCSTRCDRSEGRGVRLGRWWLSWRAMPARLRSDGWRR